MRIRSLSFGWAAARATEVFLAALLVFFLTAYLEHREDSRFDAISATDWFEVMEVFVPDHEVGSNPPVFYNRNIKRDFRGFWVVEVEQRDNLTGKERFFAACSGSGTNEYGVDDMLDPTRVDWEWFIGRPCVVPPGIYRLVVTWDMRVEEFDRVKRYRALSNVFTVYPEGELPDP